MASRTPNGTGTIYRRSDGRFEGAAFVHVAGGGRKRARVYAKTHVEAQRKLAQLIEDSRRGVPLADGSWTVESFLTHWLETIARPRVRPLTATSYEALIRLYIVPKIGSKRLSSLNVADVQTAINDLLQEGSTPRTVEKVRAVLRAALSAAMRQELLFRNVAKLVQLPRSTRKPIEPWSIDEAKRFVAVAHTHRWYPAFMLLLGYGLRKGEALGLRWSDVDFSSRVIHIRQQIQRVEGSLVASDVKTEAGQRRLPMTPQAEKILRAEATRLGIDTVAAPSSRTANSFDGLITTTSTGGPVDPQNILRAFYELVSKADIRRITIHQMRHTVATMLAALGTQERDAQLILGHAHVTTTQQIYQHGDLTQRSVALTGVAEVFDDSSEDADDEPKPVAGGSYCRQVLPSNGSPTIDTPETQDPHHSDVTGVVEMKSSGTPSWARTSDLRLRSFVRDTVVALPASVLTDLHARTRRHILGCVAVNCCRQSVRPYVAPTRAVRDLAQRRRALREALTEQLRQKSFPLSLITTSRPDGGSQ